MDWLFNLVTTVMALSFCQGQHEDSCSVFSKDQYVEVGSSTEVLCQTTCVNGRIFWTINNKAVSDSLSETINSTHAVLPLRNFSLHRATVNCHSRDTRHILGGATIWMYSKPRSISCVLHYEEGTGIGVPQLLTCTWEHLVYSSLKVNYTVLYSSESNNILVEICNSSVTNCTVKGFYSLKNIQLLVGEDFNITVRAKTAAWEAYSDSQELHPFHILKINPPQFEVAAFSDHLLVTWNRTRTTVKHHCQVRYRKVSSVGDAAPEHRYNKTLHSERMVKIRIDEALDSCTSYRVSVCWALDEAPWSAWSREKTVLTKLNRNHIRLRLWRKVKQVENKDQRTVSAMWTDFPSTCRGTFTHTIKQSTVKNDSMEADNSSTTCSNNSTCDVSVSRGAHWLTLSVFHDQLLLTEDSVYVPAAEENLPQVTQIQSVTFDGIILVSWRAPNPPVGRYMIDWTHDGNQYNWKESADTNATLSDLVDRKPYNITVTPLFDNKTGLGTQALQVCSRVGEPGSVSINNVQAEDTSAFISWSTKAQDPCSGEVVTYTVFYEAREGLRLNVTVNHTQQEINLRSLSPSTQYSIHVVSTALTGMSRSTERVFKTKTDPNLFTKVAVCGCVFLFVAFLILGGAFLRRNFQKKPVPNPGLSSVALWPSLSHRNGLYLIQPFANPTESAFDKVHTEGPPKPPTLSLDSLPCDDAACDQGEKDAHSAITKHESSSDSAGVEHLCSAEESQAFLSAESSPVSPYRSQTSADSKSGEHMEQQEKTGLTTVYVTLDMFENVQQR